ncbi:MAG: APC family permease [Microbacteriaceae bacterium]
MTDTPSTTRPALERRLGLGDAVTIGLGSMIGAGVFVAFAPAAAAAGSAVAVLIALSIAGLIAYCNATASAQLAAQYPTSGGTYIYGRERLGSWWGFLAGWSFVIGKTASCAAMALTFAAYAAPSGWERPIALVAVVALATINYRGITRTALAARVIVVVVLMVLVVVVAAGATTGLPEFQPAALTIGDFGLYGVLQAAGLLFFAFAGYARIATLGEEVREPRSTIPRAILIALGLTGVVYGAIAVAVLGTLGHAVLAESQTPLADVVAAAGWGWAGPVVQVGAAAAALGALLALIAGVGRTSLAMARNGDLPQWLAAVHPRFAVPHRAEVALAVVVSVVVIAGDVRGAIGFSSFGVLLYYFITNVAAFTQGKADRLYARAVHVVGAAGCVILVATLPVLSSLAGLGVLCVGVALRLVSRLRNTYRLQ